MASLDLDYFIGLTFSKCRKRIQKIGIGVQLGVPSNVCGDHTSSIPYLFALDIKM